MKKSKILLILLLLSITGAIIAYKIAYKPHETIEEQKVEFTGKAKDVVSKIQVNPTNWENKIVELTGMVSQKDNAGIMLNSTVYCQFKNSKDLEIISESQRIKIKGRIIGYDDLLEELKLDQVILTK